MAEIKTSEQSNPTKKSTISRRDIIKGLATVPVLGAFFYGWYKKRKLDTLLKNAIQEELTLDDENPVFNRKVSNEKQVRLGIIGTGSRGRALLKACGYLPVKRCIIKSGPFQDIQRPFEVHLELYGHPCNNIYRLMP